MKFKLDENLPAEIKVDLNAAGHEADTVVDEGLGGASDSQILSQANTEGRVLLTMD
jgi:predicted nuclease of predicted toxin-antitoxin system